MPPTTIHSAPALDSFTTLAEHQSQTPTSFYSAKPVLHYHVNGVRALISQDQSPKLPLFTASSESQQSTSNAAEAERAATGSASVIENVDVFISSENLTLFNSSISAGVSIPYPTLSLHAIQRLADPTDSTREVQGLYIQLELSDPYGVTDNDEPEVVELTLIPSTSGDAAIKEFFEAISNCSSLHPDPTFDDEDMEDGDGDSRIVFEGSVGYDGISGLPGVQRGAADGGLPPPFPGSGGWITAENVSEYFDAEGNWIADAAENGQNLGEGAGRVRTREEVDEDGVNGHGEHEDDAKRPRTD